MATIRVTRELSRWRDRFRKYRIFVDGVRAGAIRRGETASLEVPSGDHTIQMRMDWARSVPLSLSLVDGAQVNLICGPNYSAANALGALFKPNEWIYLDTER